MLTSKISLALSTLKGNVFLLIIAVICLTSCNKDQQELTPSSSENSSIASEIATDEGERISRCGSAEHMKELLKDPTYQRFHQNKLTRLKNASANSRSSAGCTQKTVLPLAIHFQGISNPDPACLARLARQQVDILNKDFQGKNADRSKWDKVAFAFPGANLGETCFDFQIANRNHPKGFGLAEGAPAITINQTSGSKDPRWAGYINIFVQFNINALGYAPIGGTGQGDGVRVNGRAFGAGKSCGNINLMTSYNLGRTLTHEIGHYLFLPHIWADEYNNGGCNRDDGIEDTPTQAHYHDGCPGIGTASCGTNDMFMNFMDYVDDVCMYMFSAGQSDRMTQYVNTSLQHVKNKANKVIAPTTKFDENAYYRLTTAWQGEGKSLDVINDGTNNRVQLAKTGGYSGQFWKLTPTGGGYYRLTTMWQGTGKSLDIKNDQVELAKTGSYTGQFWKITPTGGGYYRLTTYFKGEGQSLDVINDGTNNRIRLAKTGNYSGQFWKLTKI